MIYLKNNGEAVFKVKGKRLLPGKSLEVTEAMEAHVGHLLKTYPGSFQLVDPAAEKKLKGLVSEAEQKAKEKIKAKEKESKANPPADDSGKKAAAAGAAGAEAK